MTMLRLMADHWHWIGVYIFGAFAIVMMIRGHSFMPGAGLLRKMFIVALSIIFWPVFLLALLVSEFDRIGANERES